MYVSRAFVATSSFERMFAWIPRESECPYRGRASLQIKRPHRAARKLGDGAVGRVIIISLAIAHHGADARERVRVARIGVRVEEDAEAVELVCKRRSQRKRASVAGSWARIGSGKRRPFEPNTGPLDVRAGCQGRPASDRT